LDAGMKNVAGRGCLWESFKRTANLRSRKRYGMAMVERHAMRQPLD